MSIQAELINVNMVLLFRYVSWVVHALLIIVWQDITLAVQVGYLFPLLNVVI